MLGELFTSPALWFTVPALLGTGVFLIKLCLILVGFDGHDGAGGTDAGGLDGHGDAHGHAVDGTGAFKLVSVQAAIGFVMGFGWFGLVGLKSFDWSAAASVSAGLVGGAAMGVLVSLLMHGVRRLEVSGSLGMDKSVGLEAEVYAGVPAKGQGRGQVRVVIQTRERIVTATSDGPALPTGSRVRVVKANADNSVVVMPA